MPPILEAITNGLAVSAVALLLLIVAVFAIASAWPIIRDALKRLAPGARRVFLFSAAAATLWAGAKFISVRNAGADAGIALCAVEYEHDTTNSTTAVRVTFTGSGVGLATPVSYRNAETENWTEVEKIAPTITTDGATNALNFTAAGLVGTNLYWWVGTETPAVIIETKGIEITHFTASSSSVQIMWTCDDPNATEFAIQRRRKGAAQWETVGVTTSLAFVYVGFTVGETWEWRVSSTYAEDNQ